MVYKVWSKYIYLLLKARQKQNWRVYMHSVEVNAKVQNLTRYEDLLP